MTAALRKFKVSKAQYAKVRNPLPIPTICPNCGAGVERCSNSVVYRKEYGEWPFIYRCLDDECDSYVGIHLKTDIPLGTLANKATRTARKEAKSMLRPMWEDQGMKQDAVYCWLAEKMGIANADHCHIGWFDIAQCARVVEILKTSKGELA
jgi:Protein of unknown function (DUF3268).